MKKKEDLFFKRTLKIFVYLILPLLLIFGILNTNITGFSINSEEINSASIVIGSFLGIITLFFVALLVIIKLRHKT